MAASGTTGSIIAPWRLRRTSLVLVLAWTFALGFWLPPFVAFSATTEMEQASLEAEQAAVNAIAQRIQQDKLTDADIPLLLEQLSG